MSLFSRILAQFSRPTASAPSQTEREAPLAGAATAGPAADDAALQEWLAGDAAPPYAWADLAAHPARIAVMRLMKQGASPEDIESAFAPLAQGTASVDRMLRADSWLRQGEYGRAQPLLDLLAGGSDIYAARAALLLGEGLFDHGEFPRAVALAERAYALAPQSFGAMLLLGTVRDYQRRHVEALALFQQALTQRPDSRLAIGHVAVALMGMGRLLEGIARYNRVEELVGAYPQAETCPVWEGEPLDGRHLLVIFAYGYGDVMQFLRFVAMLREREPGARISFYVETPLARLARQTGWFEQVHEKSPDRAGFDCQITTMRLPLALRVGPGDLARRQPYLHIAPEDIAAAKNWLPPRKPGVKRVGLRRAGRQIHFDAKRSIPFEKLAPLFAVPGIEWVALTEAGQDEEAGQPPFISNPGGYLTDFYATGALMHQLDLVISADTSVVHLAGALGRPVWLLARPDYEWRWGDSGSTSPWYGSLRVFRHPPLEFNWDAVIADVAAALRQFRQA
jgi:tetratricopeptide (TPR) repeat protein